MDRKCPENGNIYKVFNPFRRSHAHFVSFQSCPADNGIQHEITCQNSCIPEKNRVWSRVQDNVEYTMRLSHIHNNEKHTHDNGTNGEKLTKDNHTFEFYIVVEISRKHEHNSRRCNPYQIGELCNIKSPRIIPCQPGNAKTVHELINIYTSSDGDNCTQKAKPCIIFR